MISLENTAPKTITLIGIGGGIGSGKSVVSRILRNSGYYVYDCDSECKMLMDNSEEVKQTLKDLIGENAVSAEGVINRPLLAAAIFGDPEIRKAVDRLTHRLVREHLAATMARRQESGTRMMFVESAILATSGLDRMCDSIWIVDAPEETRIRRVMRRNGLQHREVVDRIKSQEAELENVRRNNQDVKLILNDDETPLLPQIQDAVSALAEGTPAKIENN